MASQPCWRCLSLPSARSSPSIGPPHGFLPSLIAPFSTSTPFALKGGAAVPIRGARTTFIKKKKTFAEEDKSKRPQPGERKALRKRIVLSNTNALEVPGMPDFTTDSIGKEELRGQVMGISMSNIDQLRAVEAFKTTQAWGMFRRPGMLVREETVQMGRLMEEIGREGETARRVLVGEKRSGKSLLALQAMLMAFLKAWTVINIPEAQDLIIGHTPYAPLPSTTLFTQPAYIASLLSAIQRANPHLENLLVTNPPSNFPIPITNMSLSRLASLGASDPELSYQIFSLLLSELTLPATALPTDQRRPPMLISMDGLQHAMKPQTAYRTAAYRPIHAFDLAVIDTFTSFLSGKTSLPNGGLVLGVTSASNTQKNPSLDLALSSLQNFEDRQRPELRIPEPNHASSVGLYGNPFEKYDPRVLSVFANRNPGGVDVQRVEGLSREEARGLVEYWARSGLVREVVSEGFVGEKWTLSGGGLVGELERGVLGGRI